MYTQQGRKAKLHSIGPSLEGGLIFQTTSSKAVYLPVGTIHAVFTTTGGFLHALDFTTPESSKTYAPLFVQGIDRVDEGFRGDCFRFFIRAVELGLDNQREGMVVRAWVDANERIREYGTKDKEWQRWAMVIWEDYLGRREVESLRCPCGRGLGDCVFPVHFRIEHLWRMSGKKELSRAKRAKISAPKKHTEVVKARRPSFEMVLRSSAVEGKRKLVQKDEMEMDRVRPAKRRKR